MNGVIRYVFTNPFGNTLAILNLTLMAINRAGISHALGADFLVSTSVYVNMPAHICAAIAATLTTHNYFGVLIGRMTEYSMFDLGFVYLEWTVIGALSCAIANEIRRCRKLAEEQKGNTGEFAQYSSFINPDVNA